MRQICIYLVLGVLVLAAACQASTITFDNPPAGLVPNPSYFAGTAVSADAELTNQFENLGAIFSTVGGSPFAALVDLGTGHAVSGTNGIGAVNSSGALDYALDTDIFLVVPGTSTPAVTDSISIQGDEIPSFGNVVFTAYDVNGNEIATSTIEDTGGNTFSLSGAGIHEFRLHSTHGDVAYDNLVFDVPTAPQVSGVPEPAGIAFIGLPLLLAVVWKRRLGYVSPASRRRSQA
jgi:hypothetical protein